MTKMAFSHYFKRDHKKKGKKRANFTMMLIPHSQEAAVKYFSLPVWVIKASALAAIFMFLLVGFFVSGYFYKQSVALDNQKLRQINSEQAQEIKELKSLANDMQHKLAALMEIDREVRAKVGLLETAEPDILEELQNADLDRFTLMTLGLANRQFASRTAQSLSIRTTPVREQFSPVENLDSLSALKEELEKMDRLLTEQAKAMDKLKYDLEKQFAFEQAIPFAWPHKGYITSPFGWRDNPFDPSSQEYHEGLDIDGSYGAPVCAAGNGVVTFAGYDGSWGNVILISHGFGYVSMYAHNASLLVSKGDKVERGQIIARLGSTGRATGAHLHFGIAYEGKWIDPQEVLE